MKVLLGLLIVGLFAQLAFAGLPEKGNVELGGSLSFAAQSGEYYGGGSTQYSLNGTFHLGVLAVDGLSLGGTLSGIVEDGSGGGSFLIGPRIAGYFLPKSMLTPFIEGFIQFAENSSNFSNGARFAGLGMGLLQQLNRNIGLTFTASNTWRWYPGRGNELNSRSLRLGAGFTFFLRPPSNREGSEE